MFSFLFRKKRDFILMDGKALSLDRLELIRQKILEKNLDLLISVILVGKNPASETYIKIKKKYCEIAGIKIKIIRLDEKTSLKEISLEIEKQNQNPSVDGFFVQFPLPDHLHQYQNKIPALIKPEKDIDGFAPINVAKTFLNLDDALWPATPRGVITLLKNYQVPIAGSKIVVIGASNIVGKPLAIILQNLGATVTVCNSKTKNLEEITKQADILCVAVGKRNLITSKMVKKNAVVVDIGINKVDEDKICGDVDFGGVCQKVSKITPVPGGVGPMTVVSILENLLQQKGYKID